MRTLTLLLAALLAPGGAFAFCGFFVSGADADLMNNASQVVLMRKGDRTVMSMSNNYKGPPEDFAMVVPVPVVLQKEDVKTLAHDVFSRVDQLSAPRLVEYWERDPCYEPPPVRYMMKSGAGMPVPNSAPPAGAADDFGVKIEAQFEVGEYQIVILSAEEASGLEKWLKLNQYKIPQGASKALAPYVANGTKFFVAKVDIEKVKKDDKGFAVLSPLRFSFPSKDLRLPVRLGLLNAQGDQDLIVYVLHPDSRFEMANYKNVFIPSNVEVTDETRQNFASFYAQLFDETLRKAGGKAVVTEYSWQSDKCDPCPVPPLTPNDIYTLGGDLLGEGQAGSANTPTRPGQPYFGPAASWVLTRLHTRYSKETLDEDLVFVPAKPVRGGRALNAGKSAEAPGAVEMANTNNFQGRYIIRHYWAGPVECEKPVYGVWGGPPNGGPKKIRAATDLANAPRGEVKLGKVVRSALPQFGLKGQPEPKR